jgi:hypothetical protein
MKVAVPPGTAEQAVFHDLVGSDGYVEELRRDVRRAIDRLAWIQLTEAHLLAAAAAAASARPAWSGPARALRQMLRRGG